MGFLLGMFGLIFLTGRGDTADTRATVAERERDQVAQDVQNVAGPVAALCSTGGEPAAALESAGLCGVARQALVGPVVSRVTDGLTPEQIDEIVKRVTALAPAPTSVDQVVAAVLAQLRTDPTLAGGLTEAQVRGIVLAVMAENPPRDGTDGTNGTNGTNGDSFGGLVFERRNGQCVAVVTLLRADGSTTEQTSPVGDAACSSPTPPPPDPTTEPAPPPPPDPTTEPAPAPDPVVPAPAPDPAPPADPGSGDIVPGIIG